MATFASLISTPLKLGGIIKLRLGVQDAFVKVKTALTKLDTALTPMFTTATGTSVTLTAATHFTDANGHVHREAVLYLTNSSAIAIGLAKAQSDLLVIGTKLEIIQSAGAATVTGSGGVTVTARGTVTAGCKAVMQKVSATLWLIDYFTVVA